MRVLGILLLACWAWGCGERPDELTPYVQKLRGLEHYNRTLAQYKEYLSTEGMTDRAHDIREVLESYKRDLEALGRPDDKRVLALHNEMIRMMDEGLRKLVEPDFPTFVPNAQKAVRLVEGEMTKAYHNFERLWTAAGKTDPFPLKWPEPE